MSVCTNFRAIFSADRSHTPLEVEIQSSPEVLSTGQGSKHHWLPTNSPGEPSFDQDQQHEGKIQIIPNDTTAELGSKADSTKGERSIETTSGPGILQSQKVITIFVGVCRRSLTDCVCPVFYILN